MKVEWSSLPHKYTHAYECRHEQNWHCFVSIGSNQQNFELQKSQDQILFVRKSAIFCINSHISCHFLLQRVMRFIIFENWIIFGIGILCRPARYKKLLTVGIACKYRAYICMYNRSRGNWDSLQFCWFLTFFVWSVYYTLKHEINFIGRTIWQSTYLTQSSLQ